MSDQLTHVRREFTVVETGKEIRQALRRAFPGVKFSLRGSRGTGYGWFSLSWTDGPTDRAASAICGGFRSSYFDGMDDSTHTIPSTLYALEDGTLYEPRWHCNGVNTSRDYSAEAKAWARSYIDAHGGPDNFTDWPAENYHLAIHRVLSGVDMVSVDWAEVPLAVSGFSGRHVPSSYCIDTRVYDYPGGHEPKHRAGAPIE